MAMNFATSLQLKTSMRYKIRFGRSDAYYAAQEINSVDEVTQVRNAKRNILSIELPSNLEDTFQLQEIERQFSNLESSYGAIISEEYQYDSDYNVSEVFYDIRPDNPFNPSLNDVIRLINAEEAWQSSTGEGIAIAVIDTGIDGRRPEFPPDRRVGQWSSEGNDPWEDIDGHGTMCACIAAATDVSGGVFRGVAPGADLISCKTLFYEVELISIYDHLTYLAGQGLRIVAINSWGINTGTSPEDRDNDVILAIEDALEAGVIVVFSAGNNHRAAGGSPSECSPNSIWRHKCRSDVLTVGACQLDRTMWFYSSRGPGQDFGQPNTNHKPDVVAPTPANGRILHHEGIVTMPSGWGTSGACPQVGGLAALLLSQDPQLQREDLFNIIRDTATPLGCGEDCEGAGLIDCLSAIDSLL
jgi:serine protease AprX